MAIRVMHTRQNDKKEHKCEQKETNQIAHALTET